MIIIKPKKQGKIRFSQKGFTLVELAIVLMIIGLLIGGVLRGQELLQNTRITAQIEQIKAYQSAFHTFVDVYNNYPGDMSMATVRLPNCTSTNSCQNGDGNAIIGIQNVGQGAIANEPWQAVDPTIAAENTQFWKHLALAHLITGIDPSAATPEWGHSHPVSKINSAGFFVRYSNLSNGLQYSGHLLVLRNNINGQPGGCTDGFCEISPQLASRLDRKMDDGMAVSGDVWSISVNWNIGCGVANSGANGPTGYNEKDDTPKCDMVFKLN